ncbi:Uncharacterised protein [uncultured archaeon]|nr:Uncharacterised protein [uncultured archaeon]
MRMEIVEIVLVIAAVLVGIVLLLTGGKAADSAVSIIKSALGG